MFKDMETGKLKLPKSGQCIMCNSKETKFKAFGYEHCEPCWNVLGNEEEMEKRIKWD